MPITVSPAVSVTEQDLTLTTPAVSTSIGAVAGAFEWGPVDEVRIITSENNLVRIYGEPDNKTANSFFTAANYLAYSNNLRVARVISDQTFNASSFSEQAKETFDGDGNTTAFDLTETFSEEPTFISVFVDGVLQTIGAAEDYETSFTTSTLTITFNTAPASGVDNIVVYANYPAIKNLDDFDSKTGLKASFYGKYPGTKANGLKIIAADSTEYANLSTDDQALFDDAPTGDEIHVAIIDVDGDFGEPGTVLELWNFLSKNSGDKFANGETSYYVNVINRQSRYVISTGTLDDITDGVATLGGGTEDNENVGSGELINGYDLFSNGEEIDVNYLISSTPSLTLDQDLIAKAKSRADAVAFISALKDDVVNNKGNEVSDIKSHRANFNSNSYGFFVDNWKYQYDKYNDVDRWVPLNGDIAGLAARTAQTRDPWWSFAGFNRGQIKNVKKLAWQPNRAARDELYKKGINSVIKTAGSGTILLGDKTMLTRPSAFDRINVRMLFIIIEKSIATASKFLLFEFNDEFTRNRFINLVEPFLADVQGRRGIEEFRVVANEQNNTAQVINTNRFVGDIFINPARSINFITLNFVATPNGVDFEEIESAV